MADMMKIYQLGKELGYTGPDLQNFVEEFQKKERETRAVLRREVKEAEEEKATKEFERQKQLQEAEEEKATKEFERQKQLQEQRLQHEMEVKEAEVEMGITRQVIEERLVEERIQANKLKEKELALKEKEVGLKAEMKGNNAKTPKLPVWQERDDMDSYLARFEKFATAQAWDKAKWSINLSALLTGKALEVYYRMSTEEMDNYEEVKEALLKNFQFTEDGFRQKFFSSKAQQAETAAQYYTRLQGYMDRWLTLAKTEKTYDALRDLMIKTTFLNGCHVTIATHLKEWTEISNKDLVTKADIYLQAHGITNLSQSTTSSTKPDSTRQNQGFVNKTSNNFCQNCKRSGHRTMDCRSSITCGSCYKVGHKIADCKLKGVTCHFCKGLGHLAPECPKKTKVRQDVSPSTSYLNTIECFLCKQRGHLARNCPKKQTAAAGIQLEEGPDDKEKKKPDHECCGCPHAAMFITDIETELPIEDVKEIQRDGKSYRVCSKTCKAPVKLYNCFNLPTAKCVLNGKEAKMMRDSGCTGVVVHQKFVNPEDYSNKTKLVLMIDGSVKTVPVARVCIDSPYYKGDVEAMVMETPVYDVVLGNIQNARNVGDPDRTWKKPCTKCHAVKLVKEVATDEVKTDDVKDQDGKIEIQTLKEAQVKIETMGEDMEEDEVCMTVKTRKAVQEEKFTKQELVVEEIDYKSGKQKDFSLDQQKDETLKSIWSNLKDGTTEVRSTKAGKTWYELKNNILYRMYTCPRKEHMNKRQVVLPIDRRLQCMKLAHSSLLGGHMGVMKTMNRITNKFYWPGIQGDVTRYCRSCDICQRTMPRGKISHVPLDEMPKIDVPFKRVAVDIVGPIYPPSKSGKRFILTMVDYATRYPEAIALKNIDTISVTEAMLEIYSRLGFPEEVLSDLGTNFTSDLMKEVCRLISIRRLTTTPYHPMCNGLCEKVNGVLKTILRRLANEKPEDWDRYLPAVLFAYREVPQESTGFSPFELLYGRDVRGPMSILKEVWIKEDKDEDKKNVYEYVLDLRERIERTCELARLELEKSSRRYKRYYDRTAKSRVLQEEDEVLLLLPTDNNKLLLQWRGPYKVVEKTGKYTYKIRIKGKDKIFHINMLKQYWRPESAKLDEKKNEDLEISASMIIHEDGKEDVDLGLPGGQTETYKDVLYSPQLSETELQQAQDLVQEYQDIFTDKPGSTTLEEHRIELTTSEPVNQRPYPLPYSMREIVKKEVEQMLEDGVIEKTDSPYASPIVMVKKPDGTYRLCIDYRKLNRITIFDGEPMPSMVDIFSGLIQDKIFSKFDLSKGFWQIPVRESDKPKTAFVTEDGVYQFRKMPFGAINSTATFNRLMRKAYGFLSDVDSFVDDMLVHDKDWNDHMESLRKVFEATRKAGLTIRPKKSQIGYDTLEFLGHTIGKGKIAPQDSKIQKILETPPPVTKKKVRSFIGLIGYYRSFIPNFSMIAAPLTDLTRQSLPNRVNWKEEHQKAFDKLKLLITQEPILKIPDFNRKFYLQTDASDQGVGAVLLQDYDGIKYPIAFYSRKFLEQHKKYSIIEQECLAIIWSIQKFEIYLYGREFILETDHQALTFIDNTRIKNNRVMRWSLFLQNYRFQILSIKGRDNVIADFLSRSID